MAVQHLGPMFLGLALEQVQRRVEFLRAYADTSLAELESLSTSDRGVTGEAQWTLLAEAASATAEAAQLVAIYDIPEALSLFTAAGTRFIELGEPYGLFLRALAGVTDSVDVGFVGRMLRTSNLLAPFDEPDVVRLSPPQQTYLVLGAAGSAVLRNELSSQLSTLVERSENRRGVAPFGAVGTPLWRTWAIAAELERAGAHRGASTALVGHLVAMSIAYEERMRSAMVNTYLWSNLASPVHLADIEILGITALAATTFSSQTLAQEIGRQTEQLTGLASVPMSLGLELAAHLESGALL